MELYKAHKKSIDEFNSKVKNNENPFDIIEKKPQNYAALKGLNNEEISSYLSSDNDNENLLDNWLQKLDALQAVPFKSLVLDENLLPIESIKFFYLDENWINALLNGATSIGQATDVDIAHDKSHLMQYVHNKSKTKSRIKRRQVFKQNVELDDDTSYVGFLLRSEAVNIWPGMEVKAFSDTEYQNELPISSMYHVSNQVLICIFSLSVGLNLQSVRISTPSEALHFGFLMSDTNNYQIEFKNPDGTENKKIDVDDTCYRDKSLGVLNISKLANLIQSSSNLSVSEFAFQMVVGVDAAVLNMG